VYNTWKEIVMKKIYFRLATVFVLAITALFEINCTQVSAKNTNNSSDEKKMNKDFVDALKENNVEQAEALLQKGMNVNANVTNGWTPLHYAACYGCTDIVKALLQAGADATRLTNAGLPALACVDAEHQDIKTIICSRLGYQLYEAAALGGDTSRMEAIIKSAKLGRKEIVDTPCRLGMTPLHRAAREGNIEAVNILIKNGADVNGCDEDRNTPLHYAALYGNADIVKILIRCGADVNANGGSFCSLTPLYYAAMGRYTDIMEILIQNNAHTDARGYKMTPLQYAARNLYVDGVKLLLKHKAVVSYRSATPLNLAIEGFSHSTTVKAAQDFLEIVETIIHEDLGNVTIDQYLQKKSYNRKLIQAVEDARNCISANTK
jgi:ankyrin repeat protein